MENLLFSDKITYHIYPLGLFNCPKNNDFTCPAGNGFDLLQGELERIKDLGANLLYIGPICESSKHGYDTLDYYHVDRRLGNNEKFASFCNRAHEMGFSIVLDAVFNHTGRDFLPLRTFYKTDKIPHTRTGILIFILTVRVTTETLLIMMVGLAARTW